MSSTTIHAGITASFVDGSMDVCEFARMVEDHGFEFFWAPEHTHIPVKRENQDVPGIFWHFFDQFTVLTAAAAATSVLRIGTCICEVPAHDPISLAKRVATLDVISGGRFDFGIAAGGVPEEIANHGADPTRRQAIMRERVLAMKEIWTKDEPEFHGKYVDFDPILSWPKPIQKPYPPIYMGGVRPRAIDRTIEYCDGWAPVYVGDPEALVSQVAELKRRGDEVSREYPVTLHRSPTDPAALSRLVEIGITRFGFNVPTSSSDELKQALGSVKTLAASL